MQKLKNTLQAIKPTDKTYETKLQEKLDNLTKPLGSLGRLEELAKKYGTIKATVKPAMAKKQIYTFAGDHGIADNGVSLFPKDVTPQMIFNFLRGGGGVNVLARHVNAEIRVVDVGTDFDFKGEAKLIDKKIAYGTKDFSKGPAMTREEAVAALEAGIDVAEKAWEEGADIVGTGDMGIGNTTPSSAITSFITGCDPERVTGRGTGIDNKVLSHKISLIKKGISINSPDKNDPMDVLAKLGGFEIAAIAGFILGAAARKIPVVIDGFISSTGALIAHELNPTITDYVFASHKSVEIGHSTILARLGITPVLDLDMRLGEGTGACLAISIIEAGIKILNEMATFKEAGVSEA